MSPGVSWTKRSRNKVVPIEDIVSEKIEVRHERFLRVLHFSPQVSTATSRNSEDRVSDSKPSCSRSVSFENQEKQNIIVIFFIHGVGGRAELWSEQLKHFCRAGYAVVAPDLLGHGGSSAPRDQTEYEFSELSNDMMTIFDRFSRKRNILVGHSYGSSFCCLIASARSRRVSKVVLISGGAPIPLKPETCSLFCLPTPLLTFVKPCLFWSYERGAFHRPQRSRLTSYVRAFSAPLYVLKAVLQGQKWEVGDETFHSELMVPALLIHGAQDKFVTLQEEEWMQESIYSSSLEVIQDAGHMVMLEKPEKVNWFIHNFLQRDPTTRSNVLSPSREVSKDSIHVKATVSFPRKLSLAVQSLEELPMESTDRGQSVSHDQLRRCSAVSLTVPTTTVCKSSSLPGSSTNVNEERKVKIQFKSVEIQINKTLPDQNVYVREHHEPTKSNSNDSVASLPCSLNSDTKNFNEERSSVGSFSPQQRRKGVSIVSNGPMPSLEPH